MPSAGLSLTSLRWRRDSSRGCHSDIHKPDPVGCIFRRLMFEGALWVLCELGPEKPQTVVRNPREARCRRQDAT